MMILTSHFDAIVKGFMFDKLKPNDLKIIDSNNNIFTDEIKENYIFLQKKMNY